MTTLTALYFTVETISTVGYGDFPPRRDTRFAPGDRAYVVGPYEELLVVLRHQHDGDVGSVST